MLAFGLNMYLYTWNLFACSAIYSDSIMKDIQLREQNLN